MATQSRILADGRIKLVMVVMCCITAWYLGQVLADHIFDGFLHKQLKTIQKIVQKPTFKEPAPKHHKCGHRNPCPTGTFAFTVLSGAERINPPKICFEDEILLGSMKNNFGRGMNIAIVEAKTGKFVNAGCFDLWEGDNSGQMIEFIKKAPDGSLILMATFDDSSTRLNKEAKTYIEGLGSKLIQNLHLRGNWVFLGSKGFTLPENFQREKIINVEGTNNQYGSWPAEIQIDGCFSPKTDYL
ncbi:protein FAM3B-like isoform X1 [Stegostoma tigrinum]|uniref:protein FAM3B-like isoform X1 n=1 Tax=Stegostoma tigrinum TaxID=3053191 RepID=UPI00202B3398|nr:protein FAM3B-like isoform X1 [Stegostoma tigrinum]